MEITRGRLLSSIESTLLTPTASAVEMAAHCEEALQLGFGAVCVAPCRVELAARILFGSGVRVVSVAGFPLGFETPRSKAGEIASLVNDGAQEVDVVINQGYVLEDAWEEVASELSLFRKACHGAALKIILETGNLDPERLARVAGMAVKAGADYLKTSTGHGPRGASVEDVHFLVKATGGRAKIKAAGGIRTRAEALALIEAGAERIGTSSARGIAREAG